MNKAEFTHIMAYLEAGSGTSKPVTELQAEVYWDMLGNFPADAVRRAAKQALAESQYPTIPPVGVLVRLCGAGEVKTESRALVAYATASKAVQKHGAYASVDFDDPLANAVIRDMGGWERFCDWNPNEIQWRQRDFLSLYSARTQSGVAAELAAPLDGICERQNVADGFANRLEDTPKRIGCGLPAQRPGLVSGQVAIGHIGSNGLRRIIDERVRMKSADVTFLEPKYWVAAQHSESADAETLVRHDLSSEEFEALKENLKWKLKERAELELAGHPAPTTAERSEKRL